MGMVKIMIRLKPSVEMLQAYFVNDIPYRVKLDANEGSNYLLKGGFNINHLKPNLYPDSDSRELRRKMAEYYGCDETNIMVGNGSSELINTAVNAYCDKGEKVMSFTPSFSMYRTYCDLCGAEFIEIEAEEDFTQNIDKLILAAKEQKPKIIILCNPNNPTGYVTSKEKILKLLESIDDSLIILDEAYADFSYVTALDLINTYENLIVMRTLSKAFGLAGVRVGASVANAKTIEYIWKVKVPYNLNIYSQYAAIEALSNTERVGEYINDIKNLKKELYKQLEDLQFQLYPSGGNFIFAKPPIDNLFEKLMRREVLIREFMYKEKIYNRITVGTKEENQILIDEIKELIGGCL